MGYSLLLVTSYEVLTYGFWGELIFLFTIIINIKYENKNIYNFVMEKITLQYTIS